MCERLTSHKKNSQPPRSKVYLVSNYDSTELMIEAQKVVVLVPGVRRNNAEDDSHSLARRVGSYMPRQSLVLSPSNLHGDGLNDPFNTYPVGGCPRCNSYVLNHCK